MTLFILETAGIGQSDTEITEHSDVSLYVMTPEYGAASQLEKIDMLEFADIIALNKFDKRGALDAIRDVKKQFKRNRNLWDTPDDKLPVYGSIASQFNDPGMNRLYIEVMNKIAEKTGSKLVSNFASTNEMSEEKIYIIPPARTRYLSEISENNRSYDKKALQQSELADKLYSIKNTIAAIKDSKMADKDRLVKSLEEEYARVELDFDGHNRKIVDTWEERKKQYQGEYYILKFAIKK